MSDPSKIPHDYDDLIVPFYTALGQAFTRWQHVESALFVLAYAAMKCEHKTASTIFFHVKSQDSKLQLTDKLCKVILSEKKALSKWKSLHKRIDDAIKSRNKIAHFEANFVTDKGYLDTSEPPFVLTSHHLDVKENDEAVSTNTLNNLAEEYLKLAKDVLVFVRLNFDIQSLQKHNLPPRILGYLQKMNIDNL